MNRFSIWLLVGILLTGWFTKQILWDWYYESYVSNPLIQKVDIFDFIPDSQWEEIDDKQSFNPGIFSKYEEIFTILDNQYIEQEDIDFSEMQDNALKWFVEALWDPYTSYLDIKENTAFDEAIQWTQNFEWIWAVVMKKKDGVQIEEVLKNSPAFNAWLQALDLILRIDDEPIQELDLFDAVQKIRGPKWSEVTLTIFREKAEEILEVIVTRWTIDVPSVSGNIMPLWDKNIMYLEIATFGEDTANKMTQVIAEMWSQVDWVILDLRGNWGWILPISVDVAWFFLPKWEVVTSVEYSIFPNETLRSFWWWVFEWLPVVVLIDWMSASASEIVAWAFRDKLKSPLVWTKTFGKGSVQTIKNLEDWSSLKFSVGKRYTPNWDNVSDVWLAPDVEIEFDRDLYISEGTDTQLDQAMLQMELMMSK